MNYASFESPSLQFLPRRDEAPGWKLDLDPIVVPGEHLIEYLGQDGRNFVSYGALDDTAGEYDATDGSGFASVEIFRFPDFVKAFGAYSIGKEGNIRFLPIENESYAKSHSIHVWRGSYYVRIIGQGNGDALTKLATFVADRMPPAPGKPAVFSFLPDKMRIPNSERYSADKGLGQNFLGNSFQAQYNVDNDIIDGIIIPAANSNIAERLLLGYRALYIRNGKLLDPIPNLGEDNFTAEDKYLGRAVAFRIDRFLVIFNGYKDRQHLIDLSTLADQRILGVIRKQLVNADNADARDTSTAKPNVPSWMQPRP